MANTIRIKRRASGNAGAPTSLENAELAYNEVDDILYYGKGTGGAGGSVNNAGSESFSGTEGQQGFPGTPGVAYNGWPKIDYPNNPNGGGLGGGQTIYTPYGDATSGINVLVGGQSGTYTQTLSSDGSFNLNSVGNPISATFSIWGGKGGNARGGYTGALGGYVVLQVSSSQLNQVKSYSWSVELGPKASGRNGGNAPHAGDGGYGGEGYSDADGGGGGASSILKRGSLISFPTFRSVT